jgi:hypothetical protein
VADDRALFDVLLALYLLQRSIPLAHLQREPDDQTGVDPVVRKLVDLGLAKTLRVQEVECVRITTAGDHFMAGQTSGAQWRADGR